jgi:hypothetical protein
MADPESHVFSLDPLRVQEHVHGHLGWLAAIALVHPAILLRRGRRAHLAVAFAVGVATLAAGLGVAMYDAYREKLRQPIFVDSVAVGYLFERKEHLAVGVVGFAWTGAITYVAASFADAALSRAFRKAAHLAFVVAATLAVVTAALGTIVAAYRTF